MDPKREFSERISQRIREAERLSMRNRPRAKVRKWRKAVCPFCDHKFQWEPKRGFKGELTCPLCSKRFKVPTLDGLLVQEGDEKMAETKVLEPEEVEPSESSDATPEDESAQIVVAKVEKNLKKILDKIESVPRVGEVPATRMRKTDPCIIAYQFGPGPRTSVCWFYAQKRNPGYRLVLAEMKDGRVGKRTLKITGSGVEDKDGAKVAVSAVVKHIRGYLKDRGWT